MKHLFTLSERSKDKLVEMVKLFMPFMKATKRQSDTTFFAESLKSLKSLMSIFAESAESAESAKPIFANRGVKDVRVSLAQYPTNIQRISNLYLTSNRYLTRFAAVFALVFVLGVGNVWGAEATNNCTSAIPGTATLMETGKQIKWKTSSTNTYTNPVRVYANTTITLTANSGYKITKVVVTASSTGNYVTYTKNATWAASGTGTCTVNERTDSGKDVTANITGTATEVTIQPSSQTRWSKVVVTYEAIGGGSTPTITTSVSSLSEVGYSTADFSQQMKSFTVSGSNLTTNVTVTAPTNYEVCKTSGGTYTSSVTFDKGSGTLSASTVYVRLQSGKTANNYSGNVECTSSGATTKNVALSGSVPFTVTWKANGTTHATTYVAYATGTGTALGSLPTEPDPEDYSCTGNAFFGWYDGEAYSHASAAPSVISTSTKITSNKTYNAVFAKTEGESASKTYELIISYTDFVNAGGYGANDGEHSSTATATDASGATMEVEWVSSNVMRGASPNDTKMQFRNTPGYIYNTTDLGTINSISLTNGSKVSNIKGSSQNPSSAGTPASYFRIVGTSGSGNTGYATSATINFTKTTDNTTYSNYATSCCTPLAQVNGSANLSQWNAGVHIY